MSGGKLRASVWKGEGVFYGLLEYCTFTVISTHSTKNVLPSYGNSVSDELNYKVNSKSCAGSETYPTEIRKSDMKKESKW